MKSLICAGVALATFCGLAAPAFAQPLPGQHPYYTQALGDLRAARALLHKQPGDAKVYGGEEAASREIDAAIDDIKVAVKGGQGAPEAPDTGPGDHGSRLEGAIVMLKKVHTDIDHEEDNPTTSDLRHKVLEHIDHAQHAVEEAHALWLKDTHQ